MPGQGLVTDSLVEKLKSQCENTDWYVSSKLGPRPLAQIDTSRKVEAVAASRNSNQQSEEVPEWIVSKKVSSEDAYRLSFEAIEYLYQVAEDRKGIFSTSESSCHCSQPPRIMPGVPFSRKWRRVAINSSSRTREIFIYNWKNRQASVFFASLVSRMHSKNPNCLADFKLQLLESLNETLEWYKQEEKRLGNPKPTPS
ncbi:MAG: hypothetical protein MZU91_06965 [Desulfosudis oleivorans]|nr:hypothetical protein [Desulfosudis oleivorans]